MIFDHEAKLCQSGTYENLHKTVKDMYFIVMMYVCILYMYLFVHPAYAHACVCYIIVIRDGRAIAIIIRVMLAYQMYR